MISEAYVSFETAKLLKEKGFPQEYNIYHSMVYNEEEYEEEYEVQRMVLETKLVKAGTLSSYPIGVPEPKCYCPTLQMTMKWLREVHDLFICIEIGVGAYVWSIADISNGNVILKLDAVVDSYEEAVEAAIKYSLENLI